MKRHRPIRPARIAAVVLSASMAACQTTPASETPPTSPPATDADIGRAVIQPLTDLNIARVEIPAPLAAAAEAPYALSDPLDCARLAAEISALDAALGPDLDEKTDDKEGAGELAAGALRALTGGLLPFRGVLRRITGAEAHAKAVREAILAGAVRRAYLKGAGERLGCPAPATPKRAPPA